MTAVNWSVVATTASSTVSKYQCIFSQHTGTLHHDFREIIHHSVNLTHENVQIFTNIQIFAIKFIRIVDC